MASDRGIEALAEMAKPRIIPPLDPDFRPLSLAGRAFRDAVRAAGNGVPVALALERSDGQISTFAAEDFEGPLQGQNMTDLVDAIEGGQTYVNVHTEANPPGELRGTIDVAPAEVSDDTSDDDDESSDDSDTGSEDDDN